VIIVFTIALRRPRVLAKAVLFAIVTLEIISTASPTRGHELAESLSGRLVFKEDTSPRSRNPLESRQGPWDATVASVRRHPWWGSGFGTSDMGSDRPAIERSSIYTREGSNREHGSSYFAVAEYMGLLGILPFVVLLIMVVRVTARMFWWMRQNASAYHYGVPFALITLAGLVHAAFEDWLFAAGSYLCVFFWVSAFLLVDLAPQVRAKVESARPRPAPDLAFGQVAPQPGA
jgi:O-antigen ligase